MSKALSYVGTIVGTLAKIEQDFQENYDGVNQKDKETQDLLHEIELSKFNVVQGYRLVKELQTVRQERRRMKDENFQLVILKELIDKNPNFKTLFSQAHSKIQKSLNSLETRVYQPRVKENLTIADIVTEEVKEKLHNIKPKTRSLDKLIKDWKKSLKS